LYLVGVDHLNIRVSKKIRLIQGQNVGYAIGCHNSGKSRIVYLNSANAMGNHQLAPNRIHPVAIGQESHSPFDGFDTAIRLEGAKTISIPVIWTGANVPEFSDILQGVIERSALGFQKQERRRHNLMFPIFFP